MLKEFCIRNYQKELCDCSHEEIYKVLLELVKQLAESRGGDRVRTGQETVEDGNISANQDGFERKKKVYYISAEFLIGKLLSNNLINLGIYEEIQKELEAAGKSLQEIEELEPEPSLGNGGLGRLAACFLDSMASIGISGDGIGLNYHFGLFRQVFENHFQK